MKLQFSVDHRKDECTVVDHGKVDTVADEHLKPGVGEPPPAEGVFSRDVGIVTRAEACDRNIPRRFRNELVVVRQLELGADDWEHDPAQLRIFQQLLGGGDPEVPEELGEDVIGLRIGRKLHAEGVEIHQIFRQLLLE